MGEDGGVVRKVVFSLEDGYIGLAGECTALAVCIFGSFFYSFSYMVVAFPLYSFFFWWFMIPSGVDGLTYIGSGGVRLLLHPRSQTVGVQSWSII